MGFLDDLLKKLYGDRYRDGKLTPDFGVTEAYATSTGQALNEEGGSQLDPGGILAPLNTDTSPYDPGGSTSGAILTNDEGTQGTYNELYGAPDAPRVSAPAPDNFDRFDKNTDPGDGWGWHGDDGGWKTEGGGSNDGGMSAQIALARGAYENAMRDLQSVFGQARGVYDEGIGNVGKIRDRATKSYNTGRDNILNRFEGERGNLQRESVGNADRLRGTMRALGMGGSAYVRGIGNNDKANARAIGSLRQSRGENELANTQQQTQSNDFADTQQGTLNRYLQQASRNLQSGQEKASLVNQGDVAGINSGFNDLRSSIFANNQAMQAAGGAAAGYQVNPFAPNMASMIGSLNSGLPQFSGQQQAQGGNVNLGNENLTYLEKLQRGLL